MFNVDKILGNKKSKKQPGFGDITLSGVIGKNPVSSLITMAKQPQPKNAAPLYKQKQWADFSHQKRQQIRKKHKDTDGDRVPDMFDCSPNNVMRQDWNYNNKTYPDVVSVKEKYNSKNRDKPFTNDRRVNENMQNKEKKHAAAFLDTVEEVTPGSIKYLVDNKIFIETGEKTTDDLNLGFGASRAGGYVGLYGKNKPVNAAIFQSNTKVFPKERQDLKTDILTFHHEIAHAKREKYMRDKELEPFDRSKPAWKTVSTEEVTYDENGRKNTTYSFDITPVADYEIEAEKYKDRINKKLVSKNIDVDELYDNKFKDV